MDNLTHSLIGAALGQSGLKRKTGLAMPALIIGANLPDVDAGCALYGLESLAMRRGLTHGPIALVLLPIVLTAIMVWFDRWQHGRGTRPADRLPVRPGWLLALAYVGCLTHPLMDWMNNYGIRLLEPFSHRWFYGDALFIVDPWILLMLGVGCWLVRKRERADTARRSVPARAALAGVVAYIGLNLAISGAAESAVHRAAPYVRIAVANAIPIAFWRRDVLWRSGDRYGSFAWSLLGGRGVGTPARPTGMDDPRIPSWSASNRGARAFLFWSRLPIAQAGKDTIVLGDQRFQNKLTAGSFTVTLRQPPQLADSGSDSRAASATARVGR